MLLERFRRPRWRHPDAEVRRRAVQRLALADATEGAVLRTLLVDDPSPAVRTAIVRRLDDLPLLRERLQGDDDANVRESARARYRQCLANGSGDGDLDARLAELACCSDSQVIAHVARSAREEALRAAALERLDDPAVLSEAALNDPVARLRQRAVERIGDADALKRLADAARRRDSRVARIARERHQTLAGRRDRHERTVQAARELLAELDHVATAAGERAQAELLRLNNRRRSLGALPAELAAEFDARAQAVAAELEARTAKDAEGLEQLGDLIERIEGEGGDFPELLNELQDAAAAVPDSADPRLARARLWLEAGWRLLTAGDDLDAATAEHDVAGLAATVEAIDWPASLPPPAELRSALERLDQLRGAVGSEQAAPEEAPAPPAPVDRFAELAATLDEIDAALAAGRFRTARRGLAQARKVIEQSPGTPPRRLAQRLADASARVAEWRDWRRFAVEPKQESLCEAMLAVRDDPAMAPPERLARIRALQAEWKATGGSDSATGRALWQRFSQAADEAFQPCREWLAQEASQRAENTAARQRIQEQLQQFIAVSDLQSVATPNLVRIRRTARAEWRRQQPVDDQALAGVNGAFERAMVQLTDAIDTRYRAARLRREALVSALEALLEREDAVAATAEAKRLQAEWKEQEPAHPRVERALWKRLRAASDELFARRDVTRGAARERLRAQASEAEECCVTAEGLAEQAAEQSLTAMERELVAARDRFATIELPAGQGGRKLRQRFDDAARALERRIAGARRQAWEAGLADLEARFGGEGATTHGGAPPEWPEFLPDAVRAGLAARWRAAGNGQPATLEPDRARDVVVRLEILGGLESAPADGERRLAQQVERLARGINGGREEPRAEAWRLAAEALAAPMPDPELAVRFRRALVAVIAAPTRH